MAEKSNVVRALIEFTLKHEAEGTSHVHVPNAITLAAVEEAETSSALPHYPSVDALFDELERKN